jgi:hypothetical protein
MAWGYGKYEFLNHAMSVPEDLNTFNSDDKAFLINI